MGARRCKQSTAQDRGRVIQLLINRTTELQRLQTEVYCFKIETVLKKYRNTSLGGCFLSSLWMVFLRFPPMRHHNLIVPRDHIFASLELNTRGTQVLGLKW